MNSSVKNKRGDVTVGILLGLLIGGIILAIDAGNTAQEVANTTGIPTSPLEVIVEQPGTSTLTLLGPAVAGAGVGWLIDEISGKNDDGGGSSRDNVINVGGEDNDVSITVDGDDQDNDQSEDNDETDSDNSNNRN